MITIAVTAAGGGVAQAVLRSLAVSDLDHRTVGMDVSAHNSGLYWVDSAHLVPPLRDPAYLDRLLDLCAKQKVDLLIPGLDPELGLLASARDRFEAQGCSVVIGSPRAVQLSADKLELAQWCATLDLPFVPTMALDEAQSGANDLEYPVVLKPRDGSASAGVRLIRSAGDLRAENPDDNQIVQTFLPARGLDLVAVEDNTALFPTQLHEIAAQYFVSPSGEVLGRFVSMNRLKSGVPIEVDPIADAPWVDDGLPIIHALAALGARGPINLQGKLTEAGRVMFFEMNARFTGITGVRALMGYREVEAAVRSFVLQDEEGAINCLQSSSGFVGFRHVGDTIVSRERVERVARDHSPAPEESSSSPVVFVSGATGYIGHEVVHQLSSLTTRPIVRSERSDLLTETPDLRAVDTVVHLAAKRVPHLGEAELYEVNVEGTRRLIAAARDAGVKRFIYLSSQSVYGTARRPPWAESMPVNPESAYGTTKYLGELLCRKEFGGDMEFVILRAARAYGLAAKMRWEELPHLFARRTVAGDALRVHGDGEQRMDLVHVSDLARAVVLSTTAPLPPGGRTTINLGGGHPLSLNELTRHYVEAAHSLGLTGPTIEHVPTNDLHLPSFGMTVRRAHELLGWSQSISVERAVVDLLRKARDLAPSSE